MSGLVLLCILPEGVFPGMDVAKAPRSPFVGLTIHPLTVWTRAASHAPVATVEEVRAHHEVVETAWKGSPAVLPVRFGQWFASEADLRGAIEPRTTEYARALKRVEGAGEFSLRVLDPSLADARGPAAPPRSSGTQYLRAAAERARERARADARGRVVAAELREALGPLVREDRVEPLATPHGLAVVAHLVARTDEEAYGREVDVFAAARPELRLLRTGPWPAWSFAA